MELLKIEKSNKKNKRLTAIFQDKEGKKKSVDFGAKDGSTYIDHKDENKRKAYISRHSKNPLETPILGKAKYATSPANLAMDILWGNSSNIKENIKQYKKKYNL